MTKYKKLFSPLQVGTLVLKNRIITGPMSIVETDAKEGLTQQAICFYENLAAGGAAVVTVGESIVRTECGKTHQQQIMLGRSEVRYSLKKVTDAIHAHGAFASIELNHGGAMADPAYNHGNDCIGPIDFEDEWGGKVVGMDEEMMRDVADAFAEAALVCRDCGFDMVMIHCGHGWLLHQFLSPASNKRTDRYGGDIAGRARFPLMVIDRVRQCVGNSIAVEMRIYGSEFIEGGLDIADVAEFCKMCEKRVDLINVSAGAPWTTRMAIPVFEPRGVNAELAAAVKKVVTAVPVTAVGGYADPALMEKHLSDGMADGFVLGRSILADPQLPQKARTGRELEIHRCLRCYICNESQYYGCRTLMCSINPTAGRELEAQKFPSVKRRKVIVVGGGPGGMEAAVTAARAGHEVMLIEKSDTLGGWLKLEKNISFKEDMWHYAKTLAYECALEGVDIRLNTAATREMLIEEKPDTVICAIGSELMFPPISGRELPHVLHIDQISEIPGGDGRIVIVGGGLVGCETGLHLAMEGRQVIILERREELAPDSTHDHRRFLLPELKKHAVDTVCGINVSRIEPDGVWAKTKEGDERFYEAQTVILATGLAAREEEAESLRDSAYDFVRIGDCLKPRKVYNAVREGFDAGTFVRS